MRVIIVAIGFFSAFAGSPWITAICILALAIRYASWEAMLIGLTMDMLWLPADISLAAFPYFTIGAICAVWLFEPLRSQFLR